jgi:hypothetical protein
MSLRAVSDIKTIEKDRPDDLFMSCISFEERCINVVNHLSESYTARRSLIIRYLAENEVGLRKKHQGIICHNLSPRIENKQSINPEFFDKYNPYSFWYFLEDWFKDFDSVERITIDITTFTKSYLLILLKFLHKRYPKATLRVLYTKGIYPENESLTWGVKDITILPYFGKSRLEKKNSILVLLLGYEDDRAYSIWEFIDPIKTVAIIADPPTYLGAERPSKKFNEAILAHPDTIKDKVSAMDPLETKNKLSELYNNNKKDEDLSFFIAPLGTKMQVVGVHLFFEEEFEFNVGVPIAQIIYAYPAKYNEKKYTLDYEKDKVWEFYIRPKEK